MKVGVYPDENTAYVEVDGERFDLCPVAAGTFADALEDTRDSHPDHFDIDAFIRDLRKVAESDRGD